MKIANVRIRKAISPVIATVILIAITLIAAIAIAGFVFGLFPGFTATANVSQASYVMPASAASIVYGPVAGGSSLTVACQATSPSPTGDYVVLSNSGSGSASVTAVTFTIAGVTTTATPTGSCNVGASGSATSSLALVITYTVASTLPVGNVPAGTQWSGSVALSNGGQASITGVMQ